MTNRGLGGIRVFDAQNLNYLIEDKVNISPAIHKAGILAARGSGMLDQIDDDVTNGLAQREVAAAALSNAGVTYKYYNDTAWWGDQGNTPQCTAYAALHYMHDGPVTQPDEPKPIVSPAVLYSEIQQQDRQMGYHFTEGATSLAMAKAMKARGWVGEYLWGYTLDSLIQALMTVGPVLLGINWYEGMDQPDPKHGVIRAIGQVRGGHEIVANGIDLDDGMLRLKQSWERRTYGKNGHVYLPLEDAARLIDENGDVLLMRELRV